jgi:uncharacterized membrane protein YjjP (DUF1212 family)
MSKDPEHPMSVGDWILALITIALLFAIFGLGLVIHAMEHPPDELLATLALLLAALLFWLFWGPRRRTVDRYTIAWTVIAIVLVVGGVLLLVNP